LVPGTNVFNRTYNIPPDKVDETALCLLCLKLLPSDEEEALHHLIDEHELDIGAAMGHYGRNIARLYVKPLKGWLRVFDLERLVEVHWTVSALWGATSNRRYELGSAIEDLDLSD